MYVKVLIYLGIASIIVFSVFGLLAYKTRFKHLSFWILKIYILFMLICSIFFIYSDRYTIYMEEVSIESVMRHYEFDQIENLDVLLDQAEMTSKTLKIKSEKNEIDSYLYTIYTINSYSGWVQSRKLVKTYCENLKKIEKKTKWNFKKVYKFVEKNYNIYI